MNPKITVIIGVLNMARYLGATLDSVVRQQYPNLELIVMDGGSTDGTLEIIKQYEGHITTWQSGKDKGHSDACNKAIDIATGDFIFLLNADDIIADTLLAKVAERYTAVPDCKVITCGVRISVKNQDQNDQTLLEITKPDKLQITLKNMLFELPVINARFFHKDIFKRFGKFQATHADGSYNLSNDRDFLIKLALAEVKSEIIAEPLYFYLSHAESLTFGHKNIIKTRKEHIQLAEKCLKEYSLSASQRELITSWLSNEAVYLCLIYCRQFNFKNAFGTMKLGLSRCGLAWVIKLYSVLIKSIFKKSKKLVLRLASS